MSELINQTVEQEPAGGIGLDDATLETPNNLGTDPEPEGQALSDLLEQTAQAPEAEAETEQTSRPPNKEPGWVKKRIDSALQKELPNLVAAEVAKVKAEYEAQIKPLREAQLARDADELVKQGEFRSKDIALEYLRMKQGLPVQAPVTPTASPRAEAEAREADAVPPDIRARAARLMDQAEYAKKIDGIDPLAIYHSDPEVQRKVNSGQWDFTDVVMAAKGQTASPPSPIHSSNAALPQKRGPLELSSKELQTLNENLRKGVKVDMRR